MRHWYPKREQREGKISALNWIQVTKERKQLTSNSSVVERENFNIGDYVNVQVEKSTSATLIGKSVKTENH